MSENQKFDHYVPQYPLPDEVRNMPRDETVCHFCGVSYLIHNEIKALQDRVEELEKQLETCRGAEDREIILKKDIESLRREYSNVMSEKGALELRLEESDEYKKKMSTKLDDQKAEINCLNKEIDKYKELLTLESSKTISIHEKLATLYQSLKKFRQYTISVKNDLVSQCSDVQKEIAKTVNKLEAEAYRFHKKVQSQIETEKSSQSVFETQLKQSNSTIEQLKLAKIKLEDELTTMRQDHCAWIETRSGLAMELETLKSDLEDEQRKCRTLTMEIDQYKDQLLRKEKETQNIYATYNQKEKNLESELNSLRSKLSQKDVDCQETLNELNILKQKHQEYINSEIERQKEQQFSQSELEDLKKTLSSTQETLAAMRSERQKMILSHQNRVEQLKESYRQKLSEVSSWPEKLEKTLQEERVKHSEELFNLEKKLKEGFEMDLEIEKQKHQELLEKYKRDQCQSDEIKIKNEVSAAEYRYQSKLKEFTDKIKSLQIELESKRNEYVQKENQLQATIDQMKIRAKESNNVDPSELMCLKNNLSAERSKRNDLEESLFKANREIETKTELVISLQETVRKECEERFELTEALSQAKEELLSLKRPSGGYPGHSLSTTNLSSARNGAPLLHSNSTNNINDYLHQNAKPSSQASHQSGGIPHHDKSNISSASSTASSKHALPPTGSNTSSRRQSQGSNASVSMMAAARNGSQGTSLIATKRRLAAIMASKKN